MLKKPAAKKVAVKQQKAANKIAVTRAAKRQPAWRIAGAGRS